jgi:hypothetical protein
MTKKELHKLLTTPDWRWGTFEGAELHTLLLGLTTTFREKLEWLAEAETLALRFRANREPAAKKKGPAQKSSRPVSGRGFAWRPGKVNARFNAKMLRQI